MHHPTDRISHTTPFVTSVIIKQGRKEGNVLFKDVIKDHSDSETLPSHHIIIIKIIIVVIITTGVTKATVSIILYVLCAEWCM